MSKLKITTLIVLLVVIAYFIFKPKGIQFIIKNNSDFTIENIKISTSEHLYIKEFEKIEANKSVTGFLSMKSNNQDGSYTLELTRNNGVKESRKYGYYSNGKASDDGIILTIQNDTIISKFNKSLY
ncbi:hypothetical protein ACWGOQ_0022370 [Aquimarina sp. M1]